MRARLSLLIARRWRWATLIGCCVWFSAAATAFPQWQVAEAKQDAVSLYLYNGESGEVFHRKLENRIQLRLDCICRVAEISAQQRRKLDLAIKGDLSRLHRDIARIEQETRDFDLQNQEHIQQAWQMIVPLQQRCQAGLIDEQSLFHRVLWSVMTPQQEEVYEDYLNQQRLVRQLAVIRMTVSDLERSLPLLSDQRQALVELMETQKMPKVEQSGMEPMSGLLVLARLKPDQLGFLDAEQLQTLKKIQDQYQGWLENVAWE